MKTRNRILQGAVGALGVWMVTGVVTPPVQAGRPETRDEKKTVALAGQTQVRIRNGAGSIVVIGVDGANRIQIVATLVANARNEEKARDLLDKLHYTVEETGEFVEIDVTSHGEADSDRPRWSLFGSGRESAWIDFAIEVPTALAVQARSSSGLVRVSKLSGGVVVQTSSGDVIAREISNGAEFRATSGDIEAKMIRGGMSATTTSGDVIVEDIEGVLTATATSGDIVAERLSGNAKLRATSGDITVNGCLGDVSFESSSGCARLVGITGSINASSSSGDIEVMILPIGEKQFTLTSSSGNIDVRYAAPSDYGFLLDVNTSSGSIQGDLAIKVDQITRRRLKGIVGSGQSRVRIETTSGDVSIVEQKRNGNK